MSMSMALFSAYWLTVYQIVMVALVAFGQLWAFLAWREVKKMRADAIHAGIDIHQALVEANIYHRLQHMGQAPRPVAEAVDPDAQRYEAEAARVRRSLHSPR